MYRASARVHATAGVSSPFPSGGTAAPHSHNLQATPARVFDTDRASSHCGPPSRAAEQYATGRIIIAHHLSRKSPASASVAVRELEPGDCPSGSKRHDWNNPKGAIRLSRYGSRYLLEALPLRDRRFHLHCLAGTETPNAVIALPETDRQSRGAKHPASTLT